jgi:LysR family hydrogen peroxide-inducible transcriptional activator
VDLHHVRYFLAIAESGSFTAAAEIAFVTQPTLSAAISRLEDELGARLFERGARGVRLTESGQRFLPRARAILKEMEIARADFKKGERTVSPRLRAGVLNTAPMKQMASVARELMKTEPAVRWSFVEGGPDDLESQLNAGKLDFLLTSLSAGQGHYRQIPMFTDHLRLAVPASSRLPQKSELPLQHLEDHPLIVRTHCEHLQAASRVLDRHRVKPMVIHRTRYDERALAMVAEGLGACFIPDSFASAQVKMIAVNRIDFVRTIGIEWPADPPQAIVSIVMDRFASRTHRKRFR